MIRINVVSELYFEYAKECMEEFPECEFILGDHDFEDSQILWGNVNTTALPLCRNLKWVHTNSAGVDAFIKDKDLFPKTAKLTTATGAYNLTISEYLLATHLSLYKNLHLYRDNQNEQIWKRAGDIKCISGSTVVILGMGDIGTAYAKLLKAMGAYVIGIRRSDTRKPDFVDEIYLGDKLESVLPRADMLAITLPGTEKTKNMITKKELSIMKDGAMIMNIGRGMIINTNDLCDALESGKISAVGLDVVDPEPLPKEHKLWGMKNVIITPHTSGEFASSYT
ncbi:MAG: D-2-hydroxyacid dehydrogenase, partial [Clostridia bacterium]